MLYRKGWTDNTSRLLSGRSRVRIAPGPPHFPRQINDLRGCSVSAQDRIEPQFARFRGDSSQ